MDAENLQAGATIVASAPARPALTTSQVWLNGDAVPHPHASCAFTRRDHLARQLMPKDARVAEEGLAALESVEVRAADADALDADEGFPRIGLDFVDLGGLEVAGFP
jgi:hypothetical protein